MQGGVHNIKYWGLKINLIYIMQVTNRQSYQSIYDN